jgi:hypothetical protein
VVFVYSLLREGITPDVRLEGVTLLDQASRRATTMGTTAFYCPLTPSQGLRFGQETEATPLVTAFDSMHYVYGRRRESGSQRQMDWSQSQHLSRGWVTARVPAHFQLRKSETRRERLQIEDTGGNLTVVNGLGASVRSLWLADFSGKIHTAGVIGAGEKGNLSATTHRCEASASLSGLESIFGQPAFMWPDLMTNNCPALLRPGTYIAELDANPFLENGLGSKSSAKRTRSRGVVYGVLERPAARP